MTIKEKTQLKVTCKNYMKFQPSVLEKERVWEKPLRS